MRRRRAHCHARRDCARRFPRLEGRAHQRASGVRRLRRQFRTDGAAQLLVQQSLRRMSALQRTRLHARNGSETCGRLHEIPAQRRDSRLAARTASPDYVLQSSAPLHCGTCSHARHDDDSVRQTSGQRSASSALRKRRGAD